MLGKKVKSKSQTQDQLLCKLDLQYLEKEYELLGQIGRGSFAKVIKAKQKFGCQQFRAIKRIQVNPLMDEINQISNLKAVTNDHIISFYGYIVENNQLNIIMQLCKGSLRQQMLGTRPFTPERLICMLVQVTNAMLALSSKKIMHLDLKPQNILFEEQNHYRLCDFGCSQLFSSISNVKPNVSGYTIKITDCIFGTPEYIAPQIQLNSNKISKNSCDIWSFGIILYQIIYKKHPFKLQKNGRVCTKDFELFLQDKYVIQYPKVDPKYPIQLIKRMLHPKPSERISWNRVKQYLIEQEGKYEAQFINLQDAASKQLKLVLVFGSVIGIIHQKLTELEENEEDSNQFSHFWLDYFEQLFELKGILIKLSHAHIIKFCQVFQYKIKTALSPETLSSFKFILDHVSQDKGIIDQLKIEKIQKKQNVDELENLVRESIYKLKGYLLNYGSKDEQLNKLKIFMEQLYISKSLFCKGDELKKSCQIFLIDQQRL